MTQGDGTLPKHRRKYRCTEPGLFTNSDTDHPKSSTGSRIYFVDKEGRFLPPCGGELDKDAREIGCNHIVTAFEAETIKDGPGSVRIAGSTAYFWHDPGKAPIRISCQISRGAASILATQIAAELATAKAREEAWTDA